MMGLLLAVVVGLSVYGAFQGVRLYRADAKLPSDLAIALEVGATRTTAVGSGIDRLGMRYAPSVLRMMGPKRVDALRRRLDMAGNPGGITVDRYAARRAVYGILGVLAALALVMRGQPIIALIALAYGLVWTDVIIRSHIARRKEDIERTLPDFLDVLAVVVSAGLGFRQALERVAEKYKGPWSDELRITLRQMDMGVSRREAFDQLRKRNASEQVSMFVTALQQGEELGAPIVDTLIQIANDMRRTDAQNARRRAAQAIPKTTLVVTMVMLPATMLLIVLSFYYGSGVDFGDILG
ncbi:membrane protein [Streptomyces sp. L-9-10]|nr:membrane protein [Streptomyces sp. L-9-10]